MNESTVRREGYSHNATCFRVHHAVSKLEAQAPDMQNLQIGKVFE